MEVGSDESVVKRVEGGENERGRRRDGGENFVADGDSGDEGLGVESDDVSVDPRGSGGVRGTDCE